MLKAFKKHLTHSNSTDSLDNFQENMLKESPSYTYAKWAVSVTGLRNVHKSWGLNLIVRICHHSLLKLLLPQILNVFPVLENIAVIEEI